MVLSDPTLRPSRLDAQIRSPRPRVGGKFLYIGDQKLYLRGVTYGTFRPDARGNDYPARDVVERDFALMADNGITAVRTYTVPPAWLLDAAQRHGLYVMVGLPWEQHITFLDDPSRADDIVARVRAGAHACAGHPALLCFAIGNEIPASIVRWHGPRRVERFLERLYRAVKAEDPGALVTYVNFPTTEYLDLGFVDFLTFNVYLETQERLEVYLARLQNLAGDRPLVMAEIGLDSRRNGEDTQAQVLDWQVRTALAAGCAGAFVFAWTDEWYRGGFDIDDWDFGLTRRDRSPKPALGAVRSAFSEVPFPANLPWPRVSVVVCSNNGAGTLNQTLDAVAALDYPDYEMILVDDGSTDATEAIGYEHGIRVISTPNQGLSAARNHGLAAATGEIVAYLDDDAYPDPHWLKYLAATFLRTTHVGVGGPNIAPPGDGLVAGSVAHAPGGPVHVLLSDSEAEHIPGCNMAFRKDALEAIGGFDPRFRAAGDDVDICWRLQQHGWTLGFSPAAMVWHHRRNSVRAYWKQQVGYGRAEALLEQKWPEKYNSAGHVTWMGRLYGNGCTRALNSRRGRIYQGVWGSALFQSVYQPAPNLIWSLPLMPEWYLGIIVLAALSALGFVWPPLFLTLAVLAVIAAAPLAQAVNSVHRLPATEFSAARGTRHRFRLLTTFLHLLQPAARLHGRLVFGLTPWRRYGKHPLALPHPTARTAWSEQWRSAESWLASIEAALVRAGGTVRRGGDFDDWDLEVRAGLLGSSRLRLAIEEHGGGKQLVRTRVWPRWSVAGIVIGLALLLVAAVSVWGGAWIAGAVLALVGIGQLFLVGLDASISMALTSVGRAPDPQPVPLPVTPAKADAS